MSPLLTFVLLSIAKVIVVVVILLMCVAYTVLLERKLVGRIQNRWGPSRVGPFGLLQPLVDGAKLFLKEDLIRESVYRPLYILAPIIALGCALISIAVVPFGADIPLVNGLRALPDLRHQHRPAGHPRHHLRRRLRHRALRLVVEQQIFAARRAALQRPGHQLRARTRPLARRRRSSRRLAAACATSSNVQATHGMLSWNFFGGFQFVAFFIYLMAAYAETNRSPFDLPEAESELTAGYHTEYSSMKFAMFFMAEYANMITVGCVATLLFFGGWTSPFGNLLPTPAPASSIHGAAADLLVCPQGFLLPLSLYLGARHAAALPL